MSFGRTLFFRLLLFLYPSWFRTRFGEEMMAELDGALIGSTSSV